MPTKKDLNEKILQASDLSQKMNTISNYVLNYDQSIEDSDSLCEIIYEAKKTMVGYLKDNPSLVDSLIDIPTLRKFLLNPISALQEQYRNIDSRLRQNPNNQDLDKYQKMIDTLGNNRESYEALENEKGEEWKEYIYERKNSFISKLNSNLGKTVQEELHKNRGGVFERLFKSSSLEYVELVQAIANFQNENSVDFGNFQMLEAAAKNYLAHKIPPYDGISDDIDYSKMNKLDSTGKGRVEFCKAIIDTAKEMREKENIVESNKEEETITLDNNQIDFQNELSNDLRNDLTEDGNAINDEAIDELNQDGISN